MIKMCFRIIFATILSTSLIGCGAVKALHAHSDVHDAKEGKPGNDVTVPNDSDDWFLLDMSQKYGLMAVFALTAYRLDMDVSDRDQFACDYLKPTYAGDRNFGMPRHAASESRAEFWERWVPRETRVGDEPPCVNDLSDGLFYETYVRRNADGKILAFVIAYRGTENRKGQWAIDWRSNLSNVFGFEPAAYANARGRLEGLVKLMRIEGPSARIYAVGHSLGGGLAQQAGYMSDEVFEVYAFNTSPVTNWTNLRLQGKVKKGYPIIHRVSNGGEALTSVRFLTASATGTSHGRHDTQIQFGPKALIKGHSMGLLTCNFAKILSDNKSESAHHLYPPSYINEYVLRPDGDKTPGKRVCDDV
ncbi:hypothetical protein GmRootA79_46820 [Acidovorax sp. A79]